jgi:hypothetical protein
MREFVSVMFGFFGIEIGARERAEALWIYGARTAQLSIGINGFRKLVIDRSSAVQAMPATRREWAGPDGRIFSSSPRLAKIRINLASPIPGALPFSKALADSALAPCQPNLLP